MKRPAFIGAQGARVSMSGFSPVPVTAVQEVAAVADRIPNFDYRVGGSLLPADYESYARILHPFCDHFGQWTITWEQVTHWSQRALHRLAQWPLVSTPTSPLSQPPFSDDEPHAGLTVSQIRLLVPLLRAGTLTPEHCYFAIWSGYGLFNSFPEGFIQPAVLSLKARDYLVFHGTVDDADQFGHSVELDPRTYGPNLWWPADQGWMVATDIDLQSTYVGGSQQLVAQILAHPGIEAFPAGPDDLVSIGSDEVNA